MRPSGKFLIKAGAVTRIVDYRLLVLVCERMTMGV